MNKYFYNNNINNFAVLYILGILITHSASLVPEKYINSKKNFNNIINNFDIIANDVYKIFLFDYHFRDHDYTLSSSSIKSDYTNITNNIFILNNLNNIDNLEYTITNDYDN